MDNLILPNQDNNATIVLKKNLIFLVCSDNTIKCCIRSQTHDIFHILHKDIKIKSCFSCVKYNIVIDNIGKAYGFGSNKYNQYSILYTEPDNRYILCAATGYTSILLKNDNIVVVSGCGTDIILNEINKFSKTKSIIYIYADSTYYLFLFDDGSIEGFGIKYDQDNDIFIKDPIPIPIPILDEGITYIACNIFESLIILLTSNNKVEIFYCNDYNDNKILNYKNKTIKYSENNLDDCYVSCSISTYHIILLTAKGVAIIMKIMNNSNIIFRETNNKYIMSYSNESKIILLLDNGTIKMFSILYTSNDMNFIPYEITPLPETLYYGCIRLKIYTISLSDDNKYFNFKTIGCNEIESLLIIDDSDNFTSIIVHLKAFTISGFPKIIYDINKSKLDSLIPESFPNIESNEDLNLFIEYYI